jgi:predicted dehydrogenase
MDVPRFAVVGMGGFAKMHLRYVQDVVEAGLGRHVAQVAIPSDQELSADEVAALRAQGVEVFSSLREMLAEARERIEVTCLPTGTPLHRSMAVAALEAGTNVLVEKPAAGSIQDVEAMIRARDASGKLCAVGYQHVYRPDTQRLKQWVCEGRFGAIRRVKSFGCWPRNADYYQRNGWAARLAVQDTWVLDSPHNNALAHAVNAMCYVACSRPGESLSPTAVQAELYRANPIESADTAVFRADTREGVEVFFGVSHCTDRLINPTTVFETDKARIEWTYGGDTTICWHDGKRDQFEGPGNVRRVAEDVAEVLLGRKESLYCPLEVARAQTLCICGTFESSAIHELPTELRSVDGRGFTSVRGMTEAVVAAFEKAALFSEIGVEWAKPGEAVSLEGYDYFPTFRRRVGA